MKTLTLAACAAIALAAPAQASMDMKNLAHIPDMGWRCEKIVIGDARIPLTFVIRPSASLVSWNDVIGHHQATLALAWTWPLVDEFDHPNGRYKLTMVTFRDGSFDANQISGPQLHLRGDDSSWRCVRDDSIINPAS
jgi:hypothetical protein